MKGHFACLLYFWPVPCSIPQTKCTSLLLEPCISDKVLLILFRTVFACSVSFVASSTLRVLPHLAICQLWMSLDLHLPNHCMFWAACTLGFFWVSSVSRIHSPLVGGFLALGSLGCAGYHSGLQFRPFMQLHYFAQRQIHSTRAAPIILAGASIPYALFTHCWLTW